MTVSLLGAADPAPVILFPEGRPSPFVLVSDHAGRAVPTIFGDMGVPDHDWERHIAYDIGILGVGRFLRDSLGCALVEQAYSRLVIDCNRAPGHPTSIPHVSDYTPVPVNRAAEESCRLRRELEILHPYHDAISGILKERATRPTLLVSLHSFTPEMDGKKRPWHVGILHHKDTKTARIMLDLLNQEGDLCVGDNEPYVLTATSDYTVPRHAEGNALPYLEVEIRQDLIAGQDGQKAWAERLARLLPQVWERIES